MAILLAIALGVVALAFVLFPLYHHVPLRSALIPARTTTDGGERSEPTERTRMEHEQSARAALHEIELDYQLGNISELDYNTLRERYIRRALLALKSRHEQKYDSEQDSEQELDELIEEQLRRLKENDNNATE